MMKVPNLLARIDARASGERHVTLAGKQTLASDVNRDQRARTTGLHRDTRPFQVQLVTDERREVVFLSGDTGLQITNGVEYVGIRVEITQVSILRSTAEYADAAGV